MFEYLYSYDVQSVWVKVCRQHIVFIPVWDLNSVSPVLQRPICRCRMGKWKWGGTCHHLLLHMLRCFFFLSYLVVNSVVVFNVISSLVNRFFLLVFIYKCLILVFPSLRFSWHVAFIVFYFFLMTHCCNEFQLLVLSCYWPLCDGSDSYWAVVFSLS